MLCARKFGGLPTLTSEGMFTLSQDAFAAQYATKRKRIPHRKRLFVTSASHCAANDLARAGEAARGGFADGCRVILAGRLAFSHLCEQNGAINTNLSLSEESLFSYEIDNVIN